MCCYYRMGQTIKLSPDSIKSAKPVMMVLNHCASILWHSVLGKLESMSSHLNLGRTVTVLTNEQDTNSGIFQGQILSDYVTLIRFFSLNFTVWCLPF